MKSCEDDKEIESYCGSYCFKSIRPILDHTKYMHERFENCSSSQAINILDKLHKLILKFVGPEKEIDLGKREEFYNVVPGPLFNRIGSKFYYIENSETFVWFDAYKACHKVNGHLVSFESAQEYKNVISHLNTNVDYWIGLNDFTTFGKFCTVDNTIPKFTYWHSGEPNSAGEENCVHLRYMNNEYRMNDVNCRIRFGFICEFNGI